MNIVTQKEKKTRIAGRIEALGSAIMILYIDFEISLSSNWAVC